MNQMANKFQIIIDKHKYNIINKQIASVFPLFVDLYK